MLGHNRVLGGCWDITGCWGMLGHNRVLGDVELSIEEMTHSSRKLCNEERQRHGWYCWPNVIRVMKSNWAHGTCGGREMYIGLWWGNLKKEWHSGSLVAKSEIILKQACDKLRERTVTAFIFVDGLTTARLLWLR